MRARAMPWRMASAWALWPPPATVAVTSYWSSTSISSSDCRMIMREVSRSK